jgi:hypothetical protein
VTQVTKLFHFKNQNRPSVHASGRLQKIIMLTWGKMTAHNIQGVTPLALSHPFNSPLNGTKSPIALPVLIKSVIVKSLGQWVGCSGFFRAFVGLNETFL